MFAKSRLNSERGSIVLGALAVATLIAVFAGTIATQIKSADDMTQLPRIRATMAQIEVQTRLAAFSATSYACAYGDPDNTASYACSLKAELFRNISAKVDGGMIRMKQDPTWSETTSRFNAEIVFVQDATATKRFQIAPRVLDLEIPSEILQPVTFKCPDSRPIFAGYRSIAATDGTFKKGEAICKALDNTVCATFFLT
ncbi:MAG: hypothetical protein EOP05_23525 [Proteobacteria bacterium]|nr:MAG: hypothetical protein EOP05_23525 [Pseudomonadota bacterium]